MPTANTKRAMQYKMQRECLHMDLTKTIKLIDLLGNSSIPSKTRIATSSFVAYCFCPSCTYLSSINDCKSLFSTLSMYPSSSATRSSDDLFILTSSHRDKASSSSSFSLLVVWVLVSAAKWYLSWKMIR